MRPVPARTRTRLARGLAAGLAALLGAGLLVVVPASPAAAAEVYTRPADGTFEIEGHGWGHGRGMSQHGAQGAASLGRTADQITAFYYPGTTRSTIADAPMRVWLSGDDGADTQVLPATGLVAVDVATGTRLTLPSGPARWRAVASASGLSLQRLDGSAWSTVPLGGRAAVAGPLRFGGPTFVRVVYPGGASRDYRGVVQAVKTGASSTSLQSVNVLPMESYLLGVVPRESSASWAAAALQSQAIAARSYSANKRHRVAGGGTYDICDTTACQVYGGAAVYTAGGARTALEPASTTEAIRATAGVVRTYEGVPIFAEYSSSNGGWSTAGSVPYLRAQRDDFDGIVRSSVHFWRASLPVADIERRYPQIGRFRSMEVTLRDGNGAWGGRVKKVLLRGDAGTHETTGAGIYNARTWPANGDGLRSSWWRVAPATGSTVVSQSTAPTLVKSPGAATGTLSVVLRNAGTTSWSTDGLHLSVASPAGEEDALAGYDARPGRYVGSATSVAPGETAEFRVSLDAAGVLPGRHVRAYRARIGTGAVFGATVTWVVPVDGPLFTAVRAGGASHVTGSTSTDGGIDGGTGDAAAVHPDGATVVVPRTGSTTVRLPFRNTGNLTWPAGAGTPIQLGTSEPRNRTSPSAGSGWLSPTRPARLAGSAPVPPGGTGVFDLTLHGAGRPAGVTREVFEPLWEHKHWLDGAPTALTVVRTDPGVSRLAAADLVPPARFRIPAAPNGQATLRVRMRNLGSSPWAVGGELLGTAGDKAYPLATSAWRSPTRPPALAVNVTRPGASQVAPGEVGEWRVPVHGHRKTPGDYPLTLQLVGATARYGPVVTTTATVVKAVVSGSVVRTSTNAVVPRTGTTTVFVDVRNTGNVVWPVGGAVRSVALRPGGSLSRHASWLTATRPGPLTSNLSRAGGTYVAPGETARFAIVLAGNNRNPGSTQEPFGVLWEGFANTGLSVSLPYSVR